MASAKDPFFVGWGKIPKHLKLFTISLTVGIIAVFAAVSYAISATQDDPGDAAFVGRSSAIGVLQANPYPVLHVISSDRYERGETIVLSGNGKRGAVKRAARLDGKVVRVAGVNMARGDLKGMQLRGGKNGLRIDDSDRGGFGIRVEKLGRWRLTGEISDGKCLNGAMRPGRGLAHKACASLCMLGGISPIFVSTGPVAGSEFLMLADADGKAVTDDVLAYAARYVEIEGEVERHGDLLVFKIAPDSLRPAP